MDRRLEELFEEGEEKKLKPRQSSLDLPPGSVFFPWRQMASTSMAGFNLSTVLLFYILCGDLLRVFTGSSQIQLFITEKITRNDGSLMLQGLLVLSLLTLCFVLFS